MNDERPAAAFSSSPRVGCLPYLNSRVFVAGVEKITPGLRLRLAEPAVLAAELAAGELDLALVSSIEYFRRPEYEFVPGLSISGRTEMWSIRLFHRRPLAALRRVALDPASETTNTLLRVLLRELGPPGIEYVSLSRAEDPVAGTAAGKLDGFLKIGDPCLCLAGGRKKNTLGEELQQTDLVSEWRRLTGRPFVFALWLYRRGTDLGRLPALLSEAKERGLAEAARLAGEYGARLGMSARQTEEYVSRVVDYDLEAEELAGLRLFGEKAVACGLLRPVTASGQLSRLKKAEEQAAGAVVEVPEGDENDPATGKATGA